MPPPSRSQLRYRKHHRDQRDRQSQLNPGSTSSQDSIILPNILINTNDSSPATLTQVDRQTTVNLTRIEVNTNILPSVTLSQLGPQPTVRLNRIDVAQDQEQHNVEPASIIFPNILESVDEEMVDAMIPCYIVLSPLIIPANPIPQDQISQALGINSQQTPRDLGINDYFQDHIDIENYENSVNPGNQHEELFSLSGDIAMADVTESEIIDPSYDTFSPSGDALLAQIPQPQIDSNLPRISTHDRICIPVINPVPPRRSARIADRSVARSVQPAAGPPPQRNQAIRNIARSGLNVEDIRENYIGTMTEQCPRCHALYFPCERNTRGIYTRCCGLGTNTTVILPNLEPIPGLLEQLYTNRHQHSEEFLNHIRRYNSALSFASAGTTMVDQSNALYYRVHGVFYHSMSRSVAGVPRPRYAQLYFLDSNQALEERRRLNDPPQQSTRNSVPLNIDLLRDLDALIRLHNPFAGAYQMMREVIDHLQLHQPNDVANVRMYFNDTRTTDPSIHVGQLNQPQTTNEVAAIYTTADDGGAPPSRDIVVRNRGNDGWINIPEISPNCDPLMYTLFFPHGEQGWSIQSNFSILRYYAYRLHVRPTKVSIFFGCKLFQQYIVDAFIKVESLRLRYHVDNQRNLRVENYRGLIDHCNRVAQNNNNALPIGLPVILPSSFTSGPRYMHQLYQDSLAMVREFGRPEYFITFTCNPKWKEITENLEPGQKYYDRPDIVSRVFNEKAKEFLNDIVKREVLGKVLCHVYVVEFQKRGLPHIHLLVTIANEDKLVTTDQVDEVICAELPDRDQDPTLFNIITSVQLHRPCGTAHPNMPCMVDGVCTKKYPKPLVANTVDGTAGNGYVYYRRRNDGKTFQKYPNGYVFTNKDVVPYNPYLSKKYNSHINVEKCSTMRALKYLYKYIFKGCDAGNIRMDSNAQGQVVWNEIQTFQNARYVSAPEAIWRLNEYKTNNRSHPVIRLPVHLPDFHSVYFNADEIQEITDDINANPQNNFYMYTRLTEWFVLNQTNPEARQYLYSDIPRHYTWISGRNFRPYWRLRQRGFNVISRMYAVYPRDAERYHLRILLGHVRGARGFADLRTFNNVLYETFREACLARGLLQDDTEWERSLREAALYQMPRQLRLFFALICVHNHPSNPSELFEKFRQDLSDDYIHFFQQQNIPNHLDQAYTYALMGIARCLNSLGVHSSQFGLPSFTPVQLENLDIVDNRPILRNIPDHIIETNRLVPTLNAGQRDIYDRIMNLVNGHNSLQNNAFFINAFAGAGKTYLLNTLLHSVRAKGFNTIACAFTGKAASLLLDGRTSHSVFKFPLNIDDRAVCRCPPGSVEYENLKSAKIIIWDECTMVTKYALPAVDRLLREMAGRQGSRFLFGGKIVILGGDWRQILPVISMASRQETINNTLKQWVHWRNLKQLTLVENMRTVAAQVQFSEWLVKLGNGENINECTHGLLNANSVVIPEECLVGSEHELIDKVFGNGDIDILNLDALSSKAILCPKNSDALRINELVLGKIANTPVHTYFSADELLREDTVDDADLDNYPIEFLNSQTPSGLPPHKLNLKVGAVIMLLRNLFVSNGLCNGQRLIVKELKENLICATILLGEHKGTDVWIPRIDLSSEKNDFPFKLQRRQFPVRLAFSMTVNKAQGQTLGHVGVNLSYPVFTHGQLYVALSRATSKDKVFVYIPESRQQGQLCRVGNCIRKTSAHNVVFREILTN